MLPVFETERLILRPRTMADLDACVALDMDPEVVKYIRPTPPEDEHRAFLAERLQMTHPEHLGFWCVFEKDVVQATDAFIGWVLLVPLAGTGPEIEIGYRFVRRVWGKGYATEAAAVVLDHGFQTARLEEICAVTHPDNAASQNVLKKLGLNAMGERDAYGMSLPYFLLKRQEWLAHQPR